MKRSELYRIRDMIEKAAASLTDDDAMEAPALFPTWEANKAYAVDTRVRFEGKLYKCLQAHTSQADWTPDVTPALWTDVAEPGQIPVWRQPTGAQDAYNIGDLVHYPDADSPVYRSLIDANVWSPQDYPQGWELVE